MIFALKSFKNCTKEVYRLDYEEQVTNALKAKDLQSDHTLL